MSSPTVRRALEWILRIALGGLFVYSGAIKLRDPIAFATDISNYHLFPSLAPWLAATLPAVELVAGLAVLTLAPGWRRGAALALAGLCALFTVAVTQARVRGINVDCGCFGGSSGPITPFTVGRDLALLAAALGLYALIPSDPPRESRR